MSLFDFLKGFNTRIFVSEKRFEETVNRQFWASSKVMEQVRKFNLATRKRGQLDFFFYTNAKDKAQAFAFELKKLNYSVEYGSSEGKEDLFFITGSTVSMKLNEDSITRWAEEMCEIGYKFDCDFDGWGTPC